MADSLSLAFLVLLESLSPEQRAVFLLREVFDYPYDEIAEIVGKSEDNVRQLAVRARRHVDERRPRFEASREQRDELARPLLRGRPGGRPRGARDAARRTTSCCTATAAARCRRSRAPLHGRNRVARTLLAWGGRRCASAARRCAGSRSTASPARMLLDPDGKLISVMALDIADGQIQAVRLGSSTPTSCATSARWPTSEALLRGEPG